MTEEKNEQQPNAISLEEFTAARARNRLMINAEVASEIMNNARGLLTAKIYEIQKTDPKEAERLMSIRRSLYQLQSDIDFRQPEAVEALIQTWGPLLKNKTAFWERINAR